MNLQLQHRTALVTGASEGIGAGMVRVLAAQGVKVVATARRGDRLQALADEVERQGAVRPWVAVADVTDPDAITQLAAQALRQAGTVDILINAVGAFHPTTLNDSDRSWDDAFALNFTPARRLTQALLPAMQAQGWGRVINISGSMEPRSLSAARRAGIQLRAGDGRNYCRIGVAAGAVHPPSGRKSGLRQQLSCTCTAELSAVLTQSPAG